MILAHSHFSLGYGVLSEREIMDELTEGGHEVWVFADINNTSAAANALRLAEKQNRKTILGVDFRDGAERRFCALAKNPSGWQEINAYLSTLLIHNEPRKPAIRAPKWNHVYVIYPLGSEVANGRELRPNEYIGIEPAELTRYPFLHHLPKSQTLAWHTASFRHQRDYNTHRLLRAVSENKLLSTLSEGDLAPRPHVWMSRDELRAHYRHYPDLLERSDLLMSQCTMNFPFYRNNNRAVFTTGYDTDLQQLRKLAIEGYRWRYASALPSTRKEALRRIQKEISVISQKKYVAYFLINYDLVQYAKSKGYFHVGRGSGANSMVAYCLGITDVDPIDLDLYFERFINLHRENPPDFDLDFSWTDRDDITRYIFSRYGTDRTALLAAYVTFQFKSSIRELGKVMGLPVEEIEALQQATARQAYSGLDPIHRAIVKYAGIIHGFPKHLSVHAGGILISERPIHRFSATFVPPKGYSTVHFDMVTAEDVGLYKFDILSQRGLGHLRDAVDYIYENRGERVDIHRIEQFKTDPRLRAELQKGNTIGCFYIESPAMRMLLTKLRTKDYVGLVAASSIIRPGVAKSGMMREYILRYRHPELRKNAIPELYAIIPETYGVMVYQEDVIKVAHRFAGLTLAEADVLRRGMSGKYRSRAEFARVQQKFMENACELGHSEELVNEVWRQIESFAGYAFSKGHSASYAVESYQSLFLKTYYPIEFMVGVINNFGGFYRTEYYVHEARRNGAVIHAPCVNRSKRVTRVSGVDVYLGWAHVKGITSETISTLQMHRKKERFTSFENFTRRTNLPLEQLKLLIRAGALRFTKMSKKRMLWLAHYAHSPAEVAANGDLFDPPTPPFELPAFSESFVENAYDQWEILGFPLCNPFRLMDSERQNRAKTSCSTSKLPSNRDKTISIWGYLIAIKETRAKGGKRMAFATWNDRDGHSFDTVHFPPSLQAYPFRGKGIYEIIGVVSEEFDVYTVEVRKMEKHPFLPDPRYGTENKYGMESGGNQPKPTPRRRPKSSSPQTQK